MSTAIVVERRIKARPAAVYGYFTDSGLWARWQGLDATVDARPGGIFRLAMSNGMTARGEFVLLDPHRRVVFTWGWIDHPGVPPGSSTVEVDLIAEGDHTLVRLTHTGLPPEELPLHRVGWEHYLPRLASAAEGIDPGPDTGPDGDQT